VAHFLFVDESGYDSGPSPYGVLGGVAIEDRDVWNLIKAIQDAEVLHFGTRYSAGHGELKAKKLVSAQVFRQASLAESFPQSERTELARRCLEHGAGATPQCIAALAQAKLSYVEEVLDICGRFRCRAFASIVDKDSPTPAPNHLRKDYAYLFERFFYFLDDLGPDAFGVTVFDELEKVQSHILVSQMDSYFKRTARGRQRAGRILPEPFFVHSDLTTGVQLADLIAYIVSWGMRFGPMTKPARMQLAGYAAQVRQLRYRAVREVEGNPQFAVWSFAFITDLRSQVERDVDQVAAIQPSATGGEQQ
jgi:hypothetical protein